MHKEATARENFPPRDPGLAPEKGFEQTYISQRLPAGASDVPTSEQIEAWMQEAIHQFPGVVMRNLERERAMAHAAFEAGRAAQSAHHTADKALHSERATLAALARRLVYALRKTDPENPLAQQALGYLERIGEGFNPLRGEDFECGRVRDQ